MSTQLIKPDTSHAGAIERVLIAGDVSQLKPEERVSYYKMVCESVGLNPLTKPFEYITLNGKLTLYARKDCTDQLRTIRSVSVTITAREVVDDCYVVTSQAKLPDGRTDESIGAVSIGNLKGDAKCNAMMKAETKSKRRVTLSICGLGMLDETEIETIPARNMKVVERTTEDIVLEGPGKQPTTTDKGVESKTDSPSGEGKSSSDDFIDQGAAVNFEISFKEALPKKMQKDSVLLSHEWLKKQGIVDADGKPTAKAIRKANWFTVRDEAIAYAKTYTI